MVYGLWSMVHGLFSPFPPSFFTFFSSTILLYLPPNFLSMNLNLFSRFATIALLLITFQGIGQINLSQPLPVDPNVKVGKLPNGLTYYIRKNTTPEKKVEL